jgi:hypothetical protein
VKDHFMRFGFVLDVYLPRGEWLTVLMFGCAVYVYVCVTCVLCLPRCLSRRKAGEGGSAHLG